MNINVKQIFQKLKPVFFNFLLSFLIITIGLSFNSIDVDLWARLMNGAHIFQYGTPAFHDIFSFTNTHIWLDPEWMTSAILYVVATKYGVFGLTALKILFSLIFFYVLIFCVGKLYSKESKYNLGYFLFILAVYVQVGYLTHSTRCQVVTFIFFTIWIYLLEKIRAGNNKYLYIMPFLMLIWLNTHGGCIAGVGILVFYAIGEALNKKPFKKYLYLLLALIPIFVINPWGIEYLKFIYNSAFLDRAWISEWTSPISLFSINRFYYVYYAILILFSFLYYIFKNKLKYRDIDKVRLIMLFLMNYLAFRHTKHIALALIVYTLLFYEIYYFTYNSLMQKLCNYLKISKNTIGRLIFIKKTILTIAIIIISCVFSLFYPYDKIYLYRFHMLYPYIEIEFLKQNNINGKILSLFEYGSFIGYNYYPEFKIYVDGRQEQVYDSNTLDELMFFILNLGVNPDLILQKYKPDIILLSEPFTKRTLNNIPEYTKIYSRRGYNIFVLNKHKKDKYIYPKIDLKKYVDDLFAKGFTYKEEIKK